MKLESNTAMPNTHIKAVIDSKGREIRSIGPNDSVHDALKLMADVNVGALLVMTDGKLIGLISERDYARKIVLAGKKSTDTLVSEIMSTDVVSITPYQTVGDAMAIMTTKAVRHLPVLEDDSVIGVVSIGDLVKTIITDQEFLIEQLGSYVQKY